MADPAAVLSKTCSKCGETKSLGDFRLRKGARDGHHGWCNPCYNGYYSQASREWRQKHRKRQRANDRRRYAANPELGRARSRRWREAHRKEVNERARTQQRLAYFGANRARILERNQRRRIATSGASEELSEFVAALYEMPCAYCGAIENIEIDHVLPLSRGGVHEAANLAPACRFCNRSKKDKLLSEWRAA